MDPRYSTRPTQHPGNDWLSKLNQIREARQEYAKIERILDPYQRQTIGENIKADAEASYSRIYQGVKARLDNAKGNYKNAAAKRAAAIAHEINSWDTAKLNAEMQAFKMRVDMEFNKRDTQGIFSGSPVSKRIEQLYQEAQASGDRYKMRAAAEVLRSADTEKLPSEQRTAVLFTARAASDNLESLRNTDEIKTAIDQENAAVKAMQDEILFVKEAGAVLHDDQELFGSPIGGFAKLASTIKFEREAGNVKIKLLELDDPELTGIDLSKISDKEGEQWQN